MAFSTRVRRGNATSSTTNATTWNPASFTWGLNTAIAAGERVLWVFIASMDGVGTLVMSSGGWTTKAVGGDGANVSLGVWVQETTTAFAAGAFPACNIQSGGASEQYSGIMLAYKASSGNVTSFEEIIAGTLASGSSTNSNPPSATNDSGAAQDMTAIATRHGDSTVVPSAAPPSYGNLINAAGGGTNGASTSAADRQLNVAAGAAEDPGVFTVATEQWASVTLLIYEVEPAVGPPPTAWGIIF